MEDKKLKTSQYSNILFSMSDSRTMHINNENNFSDPLLIHEDDMIEFITMFMEFYGKSVAEPVNTPSLIERIKKKFKVSKDELGAGDEI